MWPWYGEHITVCLALFVCVLCQPVHSLIHPYINQISFQKSSLWSSKEQMLVGPYLQYLLERRASGIGMCEQVHILAHSTMLVSCCVLSTCPPLYTVWSGEGDLTVYTVSGILCLQFITSDSLLQCSVVLVGSVLHLQTADICQWFVHLYTMTNPTDSLTSCLQDYHLNYKQVL